MTQKCRSYAKQPGWQNIGDKRIYFRSKWEIQYAYWLQFLQSTGAVKEWEYEPKTFWFEGIKRGANSYKPDFSVTFASGKQEWVEVKGYMDSRSITKIKRFKKYFPEETLQVKDAKWFAANSVKLKVIEKMVKKHVD